MRRHGVLFLAISFASLAFVFVEMGQSYYVVSAIARDPRRVGEMLGTGLALTNSA